MNKHLKRLFLMALTLVMLLSCMPVFSAFADEEEPVEPPKPTTATLSIGEKALFAAEEVISFALAGDGEREELWITAPGEKDAVLQEGEYNDETVELSFTAEGEYKAYVMTYLGEESLKSKVVTFYVGLPTTATISTAVTTCNVGGSITFHTKTNSGICTVLVYAPDSEEAAEYETVDGIATVTFEEEGTYRILAQAANDNGTLDSEEITVSVISGLSIPNPGKNDNPGITTSQAPQPADYTWMILPGVILGIVLMIALIVVLKIAKKKKRAKAAQQ